MIGAGACYAIVGDVRTREGKGGAADGCSCPGPPTVSPSRFLCFGRRRFETLRCNGWISQMWRARIVTPVRKQQLLPGPRSSDLLANASRRTAVNRGSTFRNRSKGELLA